MFPILVQHSIADTHVLHPIPIPRIEFGRANSRGGGSEEAMCSGAIHADEDAEVQ